MLSWKKCFIRFLVIISLAFCGVMLFPWQGWAKIYYSGDPIDYDGDAWWWPVFVDLPPARMAQMPPPTPSQLATHAGGESGGDSADTLIS